MSADVAAFKENRTILRSRSDGEEFQEKGLPEGEQKAVSVIKSTLSGHTGSLWRTHGRSRVPTPLYGSFLPEGRPASRNISTDPMKASNISVRSAK